ncbi:MAG: transposase [Oscillospiraceae bacterium]|nr:transposase [Oscillospiraceae bacterium]
MEQRYQKKPNRLIGYDYSAPGYYFLTICARNHECLFGRIRAEHNLTPAVMELNSTGQIVQAAIEEIPRRYPDVEINKYTVMPNHLHLILVLRDGSVNSPSIHTIMQQFKRAVSIKTGKTVWQPRFYDHIIRSEREYQEIWKYIDNNPAKWALDKYYHET